MITQGQKQALIDNLQLEGVYLNTRPGFFSDFANSHRTGA